MIHLLKKFGVIGMVVIIITGTIIHINLNCIKADTVLTNPNISVVGYQIKTNGEMRNGISFRTVCQAPNLGSVISVDGTDYTVTNLGVIYTKDPNTSGMNASNILDKSYTELNTIPCSKLISGGAYDFKYIGMKSYLDKIVTFGYIATDKGIIGTKDGYTSYVRTMTSMDPYVTNCLHIRAFVEAVDEEEKDVIIYGSTVSLASVAEIAYKVYMKSGAPDEEGHNYIYNVILNKLPESNPFYKDIPEEYGWGGIVKP